MAKTSRSTAVQPDARRFRKSKHSGSGKTRIGAELAKNPRAVGAKGNPGGRGAKIVRAPNGTAQDAPTLAEIGVTKKRAASAKKLAAMPESRRYARSSAASSPAKPFGRKR
jgi:hypothetical protein